MCFCALEGGGHASHRLLSSLMLTWKALGPASSVLDRGCGVNVLSCEECGGLLRSLSVVWALRSVFYFGTCITSPQKKENVSEKHRVLQRKPAIPHFLLLKKSKAIPKPGQDLETAPGCAVITAPGIPNFSGFVFGLL